MSESSAKPVGVSPAVLVLSVLLACAVTAAAVLALKAESRGSAQAGSSAPASDRGERPANSPPQPFTQKDTVVPRDAAHEQVFYPVPFAVPPNLKLSAPTRQYEIVKQDAFGFTWSARLTADDFDVESLKPTGFTVENAVRMAGALSYVKKGVTFEEFTWEARGVAGHSQPFVAEQTGRFNTMAETEGEVIYPIPYSQPANVTLTSGPTQHVVVTEMRANGFKWKNSAPKEKEFFANGEIDWTAKGVRESGRVGGSSK